MSHSFDPRPDPPVRATVERRDAHAGGGRWRWEVFARTAPFWPVQAKRTYFIDAESDTLAAQEGIRRLVEELKRPPAPIVET